MPDQEQPDQERAEQLHHECDPAAKIDEEAHFSAKLRALLKSSHQKETPLNDCTIEELEKRGQVKEKF